ncbi:hypothetical protein C8A00DRAFT_30003 [Chaetomidium leptoderma]|uniref:Uncharacterized protein n=1 Tax=Chaetomidium leptoderma TaxID=669021 RepID=A0AAN7A1T1_9PEZI|nr:hypothetical protein C8A00DRAFT_30003 [Chaetomidium leptoderma]
MDLEDIIYSREETIAAVTDYYTFLNQMYLKESHVLQSLGKSDEVLALLAHLPYIHLPLDRPPEVAPGCDVANWSDLVTRLAIPVAPGNSRTRGEELRFFTEGTFSKISPPHVVGLIMSCDPCEAMVLDTELGIIHWEECPGRIDFGATCRTSLDWNLDDEASQEEADWGHSATAWTIPDFFEVLKEQFILLHWIPISHFEVRDVPQYGDYASDDHEKGMMPMLQDIYRQHGWPDLAVYRKSDCLATVKKAMAEKYPESSCYRKDD